MIIFLVSVNSFDVLVKFTSKSNFYNKLITKHKFLVLQLITSTFF